MRLPLRDLAQGRFHALSKIRDKGEWQGAHRPDGYEPLLRALQHLPDYTKLISHSSNALGPDFKQEGRSVVV